MFNVGAFFMHYYLSSLLLKLAFFSSFFFDKSDQTLVLPYLFLSHVRSLVFPKRFGLANQFWCLIGCPVVAWAGSRDPLTVWLQWLSLTGETSDVYFLPTCIRFLSPTLGSIGVL